MSRKIPTSRIGRLLDEQARQAIPDDFDPWPQVLHRWQTESRLPGELPTSARISDELNPARLAPPKNQARPRLSSGGLTIAASLTLLLIIAIAIFLAQNIGNGEIRPASKVPLAATVAGPLKPVFLKSLNGPSGKVQGLAWSPDGKQLTASFGDKVQNWNVPGYGSGWSGAAGAGGPVAWSPKGGKLATGDATQLRLWDAQGRTLTEVEGPANLLMLAWSPDGQTLACGYEDGTLMLRDGLGNSLSRFESSNLGKLYGLAWSPDGQFVATGSSLQLVKVWNTAGQRLATRSEHTGTINSLAWSPDGSRFASASDDRTIRLWDAAGQPLSLLTEHTGKVNAVAWSPDGQVLASGSEDKTIRLWSASGNLIATLNNQNQAVLKLAWSPDGKTLASGSADGFVRLWGIQD